MCLAVTLAGCVFGNITAPPLASVSSTSNPLVAQYTLRNVRPGLNAWVEFGPDTSYGRQTSVITTTSLGRYGAPLNILVAGMKAQTTYHMRAHLASGKNSVWVDQDQTFTTGALTQPGDLAVTSFQKPGILVTKPIPSLAPAPGVEVLDLAAPSTSGWFESVITDLDGNVIWCYPATAFPMKLMSNGDFILQMGTDLREVDLIGNTIRDVSVAQVNQSLQTNGYSFQITAFSHDILVQPNGHWITIGLTTKAFDDLPGYSGTTNVVGDTVLDIDPNGNVAWGWSAFDYLDVNRHLQGLPDWTHSNALVYTQDGDLLLSMRHQSWILKLDYQDGKGTGAVLWKLGEDGDFAILGGDPAQWFYGQHDPVLENTNGSQMILAIYDDGNLRIDSSGVACQTTTTAPACYSRATIFQVDETTHVANLLWQDLPGFFSFWGGSIGTLSNGDVEFDSSQPNMNVSASEILEVTPTSNPQTVWQMNINGQNAYRGYRIPSLYPGVTWQK
jgi:arylsulfate sulfotransferase